MKSESALKTYAKVGIESGVSGADSHQLISILYEGAILAIASAKHSMLRNETLAKCEAISKALAIIDEGLNASLDKGVGGDLALNLSSLYDYMVMRLISANLKNDLPALDEVSLLLSDLHDAWNRIRPIVTNTASRSFADAQLVYTRN